MRVFIAITLEPECKDYLEQVQAELKTYCKKGNFTKKENLHMTLRFLGEIAPQDVEAAKEAMLEAAYRQNIFSAFFQELGFFSRGTKKIAWVGLSPEQELKRLFMNLTRVLAKQGFPKERQQFRPHITLAREAEVFLPEQAIQKKIVLEKKEIQVQRLTLFESVREGSKLFYKPLAFAPFRQRIKGTATEN